MEVFRSYDGARVAYEAFGSGPPLLCVPGGPGRAAEYLERLGGLDAARTLVLLDNRGTGRSPLPDDLASLRFDRLAGDLEALRLHLGLERAAVLAHSAGCLVAQVWAAEHPDAVEALVLVTPSDRLQDGTREDLPAIRASRSGEPWFAEADAAVRELARAGAVERRELVRACRPLWYGRWTAREQEHAASADRQTSKRAEIGFGFDAEAFDRPSLLAALQEVHRPVLVVGGGRDALTGTESVRRVAASFPWAEAAVVPAAGHFPWVDEPDAFRAVVAGFLARV